MNDSNANLLAKLELCLRYAAQSRAYRRKARVLSGLASARGLLRAELVDRMTHPRVLALIEHGRTLPPTADALEPRALPWHDLDPPTFHEHGSALTRTPPES